MSREVTEKPNEWCVDVSRGLRLGEVRSRVRKSISDIRSTNYSTNKKVWVWIWAEEIARAFFAAYTGWMGRDRRNRAATVVNPTWKLLTVPNHVRHSQRVVSQNVIHLKNQNRFSIKRLCLKFGPKTKRLCVLFFLGPKCEKNFWDHFFILPDVWRFGGGEMGRQLIRHKAQPFWHGSDN